MWTVEEPDQRTLKGFHHYNCTGFSDPSHPQQATIKYLIFGDHPGEAGWKFQVLRSAGMRTSIVYTFFPPPVNGREIIRE